MLTPDCRLRTATCGARRSRNGGADAAPHGTAGAAQVPIEPDPGRPADQVLLGHIAPAAPVVAVVAIVAHHQIMPRRHVADKRSHAAASGGVLVPADVAAHAATVARRQHRLTIEGHRTEYGLVLMAAQTLLGARQVLITAVAVPLLLDAEVHRLAVDGDAVVAHFDVIARQTDQALDEVGRRVHGPAEYHHVAAPRLADVDDLAIDHRQAQPVGVLVDDDEVAVEERWHHGIGGNAERLEDERAQQQHHEGHPKETAPRGD